MGNFSEISIDEENKNNDAKWGKQITITDLNSEDLLEISKHIKKEETIGEMEIYLGDSEWCEIEWQLVIKRKD